MNFCAIICAFYYLFVSSSYHSLGSCNVQGMFDRFTLTFLFFKNGPTSASFSFIFGLFKQTIQFLQQINVKKCHVHPVSGAGIRTHETLTFLSPFLFSSTEGSSSRFELTEEGNDADPKTTKVKLSYFFLFSCSLCCLHISLFFLCCCRFLRLLSP